MTRDSLLLLVLMTLAVYRLTRLVTKDDFPPVLWVRDRLAGGWRPLNSRETAIWWAGAPYTMDRPGDTYDHPELGATKVIMSVQSRWITRVSWSPHWLAELLTCPWCASGWLSGAVVLALDLTVGLPVPWLYGPAVWGAAALLASREWA